MHLSNIKKTLLTLSFLTLWSPAFAATPFNTPELLEGHDGSIWDQFSIRVGVHDGGRKLGFFFPGVWKNSDSQVWWDTGIILAGSGLGYRTMLNTQRFAGIYLHYDWEDSVRWNIGGELYEASVGELTVNGYSSYFGSQRSIATHDTAGMSLKFSFNEWTSSVKPFIAAAYSWVSFNNEEKFTPILSFAIGAKWIISNNVDIEAKYHIVNGKDENGNYYQSPIHVGFQVRWDGRNPKLNYFKHRFNRSPDRYIPGYTSYYANGMIRDMLAQMQNERYAAFNASAGYTARRSRRFASGNVPSNPPPSYAEATRSHRALNPQSSSSFIPVPGGLLHSVH